MPEPDALDRIGERLRSRTTRQPWAKGRPASVWSAIARGALGRCPCCGEGKLFRRFLKPVAECPLCEEDWRPQQADDFPAYVAIFLTGHILAPLIIVLVRDAELSVRALLAIIVPLAVVMMIGMLQPAKGAIIALQWWFGMHGFKRQTPDTPGASDGS